MAYVHAEASPNKVQHLPGFLHPYVEVGQIACAAYYTVEVTEYRAHFNAVVRFVDGGSLSAEGFRLDLP